MAAKCATEAFSTTCAVHIEDGEGWWFSSYHGSVAACAIRIPSGVNRKILSVSKEPMLSSFLTLNDADSILHQSGNNRCYEAKIEESEKGRE